MFYYSHIPVDLDPLPLSRARLTLVKPVFFLSETCLKWQSRSKVPPIFWFWGNAYGIITMTAAWIQECGENPMFQLQSQWSPETHLLVRSA